MFNLLKAVIVIVLVIMGIRDLSRGNHYGAAGHFIVAVFALPFIYWLQGLKVPKSDLYIVLGLFIVLTLVEILYIRWKGKGDNT